MNIAIVGTGYVGLVTGTCFAETGLNVTCIDIDSEKIDKLKKGIIPIYEPGLTEMVVNNIAKNRLHFSTSLSEVINNCDTVFIAVGTPPGEDGSADLQYVLAVAEEIGKSVSKDITVINKSTVPIGTAQKVKGAIKKELDKRDVNINYSIASNPEFLKEGSAIDDFMKPDRIVVGVENDIAKEKIESLYKPFVLNGHPIIFMDIPSAEMTKYAANSMLATKISFINDIANLCEIVGANVEHVRRGIGSDPRIGDKFIYPGIGYGGSCFPKDVKALIKTGEERGYSLEILKSVEHVNNNQKSVLFNKLMSHFNGDIKDKTIAVWGLSFKPKTDDMREAPSIVIINQILKNGGKVIAYDPVATAEAKHIFGDKIEYTKDMYEATNNADCLMLLTEWNEFRIPNFEMLSKLMNEKTILDGRNIYNSFELKNKGFNYFCIGKQTV